MNQSIDALLAPYPVVTSIPVQWGEMDAFQHVNNAAYFRYFETARIAYWQRLNVVGFRGSGGKGVGPILAETSCRYLAPLTHPDSIRIGARTTSFYEFGMMHEYVVVSERLAAIAARGTARIVVFDYDHGKKVPVPQGVIEATNELERRE